MKDLAWNIKSEMVCCGLSMRIVAASEMPPVSGHLSGQPPVSGEPPVSGDPPISGGAEESQTAQAAPGAPRKVTSLPE